MLQSSCRLVGVAEAGEGEGGVEAEGVVAVAEHVAEVAAGVVAVGADSEAGRGGEVAGASAARLHVEQVLMPRALECRRHEGPLGALRRGTSTACSEDG